MQFWGCPGAMCHTEGQWSSDRAMARVLPRQDSSPGVQTVAHQSHAMNPSFAWHRAVVEGGTVW